MPSYCSFFTASKQEQLRSRIASVTYRAGTSGDYDHATHYTYDVLGNVKELVQEFKKLSRDFPKLAGHSAKLVRYDYDLVTGNVNRITYQPGRQDQFVHWYEYDADNRLTDVFTGLSHLETPMFRHRDAHYEYYLHGPLARLELGHDKVQGLDYAYTIQGWLKSVNSPLLEGARDPGRDGSAGLHAQVPADVFGFGLEYFTGDYRPIGNLDAAALPIPVGVQPLHQQTRDLWNGNIRATLCRLNNLPDLTLATAYRYDQLNRLTQSQVFRNTAATGWAATNGWKMQLNYDPNGNIRNLVRNNDTGAAMDALTYQYRDPNNNRLSDISDSAGKLYPAPNAPVQDLPNQAPNNYTYDLKGRLATDVTQNATRLTWSNTDKLLNYRQARSGATQVIFEYTYFDYDALGRRVFRRMGNRATYTVRDVQGNPLAEYNIHNDTIFWTSAPIYGAKRLGTYQPNLRLYPYNEFATNNRAPAWRGKRRYELTGHTGDVLALVSDCRKATTLNGAPVTTADVRSMQDYYPFGMPMPGRSYTATGEGGYRYGFQGMEKEDGMKGAGNAYTTEFREYDGRVGRWLSVDKIYKPNESNYSGFGNNPNMFSDPQGLDLTLNRHQYAQLYQETSEQIMDENGATSSSNFNDGELDRRVLMSIGARYGTVTINNESPHMQREQGQTASSVTGYSEQDFHEDIGQSSDVLNLTDNALDAGELEQIRRNGSRLVELKQEARAITETVAERDALRRVGGRPRLQSVLRGRGAEAARRLQNAERQAAQEVAEREAGRGAKVLNHIGIGINIAIMFIDLYQNAEGLTNGDYNIERYNYRARRIVFSTVVGVVPFLPFVDIWVNRELEIMENTRFGSLPERE